MKVVLVHHAEALEPGVDPQRPLSTRGRAQADWLAQHARQQLVSPALIWHSGKQRSRQTAEAFLRACNAFASFKMVRGLQPGDPTMWMEDAIELEERDLLLVGHWPQLPELARRLAGIESFPMNGVVALERIGERHYAELWRAQAPATI